MEREVLEFPFGTRIDSWKARAACRGMSPSVFFPPPGNPRALKVARSVCEGCQVADECLEAGWDMNEGIFGGTTPTERRRLRRRLEQDAIGAL